MLFVLICNARKQKITELDGKELVSIIIQIVINIYISCKLKLKKNIVKKCNTKLYILNYILKYNIKTEHKPSKVIRKLLKPERWIGYLYITINRE